MDPGDAEARRTIIEGIQSAVAEEFSLSTQELTQKIRRRDVVLPRQIAIYLAKHQTEASLPEIGRYFGGMHHTTVMHAIAKIDEQRRTDSATDLVITELLKTLRTD